MKLIDALQQGLDWQVCYPVVEEAAKAVLNKHTGDGMTAKELIEACGLKRANQAERGRFVAALKALRRHGLADWFDTYEVQSRFHKGTMVKQFVYLPPSLELQVSRLETERQDLCRRINLIDIDLSELRGDDTC